MIKILLRENLVNHAITQAINKWVAFYKQDEGMDPCDINTGECMNFAEAVYGDLIKQGIKVTILSDAYFFDAYGDETDLVNPKKFGGIPTFDYKRIGLPSHYWIYYNGKSYDSEAPNGVNNFFELPTIANFKLEHRK